MVMNGFANLSFQINTCFTGILSDFFRSLFACMSVFSPSSRKLQCSFSVYFRIKTKEIDRPFNKARISPIFPGKYPFID